MKYLFIFFVLTVEYGRGQTSWSVFIPDDKTFEVMVPGKMDFGTKHVLTDLGEMKTNTYLYKGEQENPDPVYIINVTTYPTGLLNPDSTELLELFFTTSYDGIAEKLGGEIIYYADISTYYIPQKIYKINYNNGTANVKGKFAVYRDRFYSIQVFSSFEKSNLKDIDTFLDTFKLSADNP
jgi:hypothetical protein